MARDGLPPAMDHRPGVIAGEEWPPLVGWRREERDRVRERESERVIRELN